MLLRGGMRGRRALRAAVGVFVLAAAVALSGCAPERQATMPAPTPAFSSTFVPDAPIELAPLSGEILAGDVPAHPSIAAKIDNHPNARPQVGLELTDIVFEELVEGGLTRYLAIWHSTLPAELGPVRSIRPMDPDIVSSFGGIIAYSGGQDKFVRLMKAAPVYNAIHGQPDTADTFFRSKGRPSPHDVLVKAQVVVGQHPEIAAPPQQFAFSLDVASATASKEGVATSSISLVFGAPSRPSWSWSPDTQSWLRAQSGVADMDSNGAQLSATNVVIVRVPVTVSGGIPKTELVGSGEAWVSTGGATIAVQWSKASATDPLVLVDANGVVVRLAPGNIWMELVPLSGSVSFS
ncbi:MAG: DUF3048 domain-containing protein [Microbacteriaceae bacterium]